MKSSTPFSQVSRPFKVWPIRYTGPFNIQNKNISRFNSYIRRGRLTEEHEIPQQGKDFGLITSRLGLLFTRLASGASVTDRDLKLIEEGLKYFTNILQISKVLQNGGSFTSISPYLDTLSFLENDTEKFKNLGSYELLKKKADDLQLLLNKKPLAQVGLKELAKIFLTMSNWSIENDSVKYFSNNSSYDLKFLFY